MRRLALPLLLLLALAVPSHPARAGGIDSTGASQVANATPFPAHATKVVLTAGVPRGVYVGVGRTVWLRCDNAANFSTQKASTTNLPDGGPGDPATADDTAIPSDQTPIVGKTQATYDTIVFYSAAGGNCWYAVAPQ